jgi:hypothetical protein
MEGMRPASKIKINLDLEKKSQAGVVSYCMITRSVWLLKDSIGEPR